MSTEYFRCRAPFSRIVLDECPKFTRVKFYMNTICGSGYVGHLHFNDPYPLLTKDLSDLLLEEEPTIRVWGRLGARKLEFPQGDDTRVFKDRRLDRPTTIWKIYKKIEDHNKKKQGKKGA